VDSLSEDMPAHPVTFYGLSREAELTLGRIAFEKWGLPVFLCRTFNLVGPGLSDRYAPAAIWRRLMEFKGAGEARFPLQNAGATRDFVDVRDAVRAYVSIVKRGRPGITYNVGSGKGVSIEEIALQLFALAGVPVSAMTYGAPDHTGRSDSNRSIANIKRITNETGWQPEVTLEQSLSDMHREATKASADNSAHSPSDAQDESVAPLRSE
jgi:GDP-4-dehydro-6-deoxy-D-mannose reductase